MKNNIKVEDISKSSEQLAKVDPKDLIPLPSPYDKEEDQPKWKELNPELKASCTGCSLDGFNAVNIPDPKTPEEEKELVDKFVSGLKKLFEKENNWTFLTQLMLSLEHCAKCQTCVDACPIYEASGNNEIYRPTYRSEVWRRLVKKYVKPSGKFFSKFTDG
ncbi:MAG: (Fe-S)-binding protein, partial [candidate division Zixibacteria bacterium]|nr:(Fe-S)-binding protein [candidate division Zixibacteria bacterium]